MLISLFLSDRRKIDLLQKETKKWKSGRDVENKTGMRMNRERDSDVKNVSYFLILLDCFSIPLIQNETEAETQEIRLAGKVTPLEI